MSAALPLLSPLVTRILELKGFPAELKTRDIQTIFAQWEDERGGFKIKWIDDITVLVIFSDPICAKRAYLQVLMSPPPMLMTASGIMAKIRPYDEEDAGSIISSVQNRPRSRSNAGGQATPAYGAENEAGQAPAVGATPSRAAGGNSGSPRSVARSLGQGHRRNPSGSNPSSLPPKPLAAALWDASNGGPSPAHHLANALAAEGLPEKAEEILASINANTIRSPPSAANSTTAILEPSPEIRKAEKTSQALGA